MTKNAKGKKKRKTKKRGSRTPRPPIPKGLKHSLRQNIDLYNFMGDRRTKTSQRNKIIDSMNGSQVNTICKIFKLIIGGKFPLPSKILRTLKRNKRWILQFLKSAAGGRKKKMKQTGGGLFGLVGKILLPLVGDLIGGILGKK